MSIRPARPDEIGTFYELWEEFLYDHHPKGGVEVTTEALNEAGRLFQAYVGGSKLGTCMFWVDEDGAPQGVSLAGEPMGYFDMHSDLKKCSILYGLFIREAFRGHGRGLELARESARMDVEKGFMTGCTIIKAGNEPPQALLKKTGGKLVDLRYTLDLPKETPNG